MTKRKRNLADKLDEPVARPGWRSAITNPTPIEDVTPKPKPVAESTSKLKRKTYLLTDDLIADLEELASNEQVGISELVRFLLQEALDQIYEGQLTIPTRPAKREIAD